MAFLKHIQHYIVTPNEVFTPTNILNTITVTIKLKLHLNFRATALLKALFNSNGLT